jgi:hypothetical protein
MNGFLNGFKSRNGLLCTGSIIFLLGNSCKSWHNTILGIYKKPVRGVLSFLSLSAIFSSWLILLDGFISSGIICMAVGLLSTYRIANVSSECLSYITESVIPVTEVKPANLIFSDNSSNTETLKCQADLPKYTADLSKFNLTEVSRMLASNNSEGSDELQIH